MNFLRISILSRIATLTASLAFLTAVPAAQAVEELPNPPGIWTHEESGTLFPRTLGSAERSRITDYDGTGKDVSIGYGLDNDDGTLVLTLYVYPQYDGVSCKEEFDGSKSAIARYKGARLATEDRRPAPDGSSQNSAFFARYTLPAGSMQPEYPALLSDLYVYCSADKQWNVKYRASWNGTEENFPDIGALLSQIGWGEAVD